MSGVRSAQKAVPGIYGQRIGIKIEIRIKIRIKIRTRIKESTGWIRLEQGGLSGAFYFRRKFIIIIL